MQIFSLAVRMFRKSYCTYPSLCVAAQAVAFASVLAKCFMLKLFYVMDKLGAVRQAILYVDRSGFACFLALKGYTKSES